MVSSPRPRRPHPELRRLGASFVGGQKQSDYTVLSFTFQARAPPCLAPAAGASGAPAQTRPEQPCTRQRHGRCAVRTAVLASLCDYGGRRTHPSEPPSSQEPPRRRSGNEASRRRLPTHFLSGLRDPHCSFRIASRKGNMLLAVVRPLALAEGFHPVEQSEML